MKTTLKQSVTGIMFFLLMFCASCFAEQIQDYEPVVGKYRVPDQNVRIINRTGADLEVAYWADEYLSLLNVPQVLKNNEIMNIRITCQDSVKWYSKRFDIVLYHAKSFASTKVKLEIFRDAVAGTWQYNYRVGLRTGSKNIHIVSEPEWGSHDPAIYEIVSLWPE